ncbi:hypothetical protein ABZT02_27375 [Streptomyces sp. NPDC005402]|uniref:hypothetical protein n=1 Tax=Streptomyces sp. NPDC005402 TaxID=3155338 RepID=UPI0033B83C2A
MGWAAARDGLLDREAGTLLWCEVGGSGQALPGHLARWDKPVTVPIIDLLYRLPVIELEQLGEFDPCDLRDRLESVVRVGEEEFAACGLSPDDICELRRWALDRESDLGLRILEEYDGSQDGER